jgi:hypothetical protein
MRVSSLGTDVILHRLREHLTRGARRHGLRCISVSSLRAVITLVIVAGAGPALVSACTATAEPDARVTCEQTCAELGAQGCNLERRDGTAGGGHGEPTGCLPSCEIAEQRAYVDGCRLELQSYLECLVSGAPVTCDGETLEDIQGCDTERLAWDRCDGAECDLRGGLSASGTTSEGLSYFLDFAHTQCSCETTAPTAMHAISCGNQECPPVCCCAGEVAARACIDDRCATAEEACAILRAAPYSLCEV